MKCRFVKPLFQNKENGYCVFVYHTKEINIPSSARSQYYKGEGIQFTAVGNNLPSTDSVEVELEGKWVKNSYGTQFQVENYQEILPQSKEGIMGYLSSGMIKGIGPGIAKKIVDKFGVRTFDVFEHYPASLLSIKGITEKKLETILLSYRGNQAIRDLAAFLTPFQVTPKKIQAIYEHFGNEALDTVKKKPFALCQIQGFGFLTVDNIAKANKCSLNDPMRIEGCIHYCMEQEAQEGNLFQDNQQFQKRVYEQLNHGYPQEVVSEVEIYQEMYRLVCEKVLVYEERALYPVKQYEYECEAAKQLAELLAEDDVIPMNLSSLIEEAQEELGIVLSAKQEESVRKAFTNLVSIITGGPGTGKTTVQRVLLYIHEKLGGENILLTAPTGRASRRMAESTGREDAMTMHSAMGLTGSENCEAMEKLFEADMIIADEFTMSDMWLSYEFFAHVRKGCRLVLVGDVNQLPSVGPGNVFRELVYCGAIPVTVLDMVFRQAEDSRIAINANRMQENNALLEYGDGFEFYDAGSDEQAAQIVEKLYLEAVKKYGADQVQVLTPFRKKGEASVDALNKRLWNLINPKDDKKAEIKAGKRSFRAGDRVIHIKNKDRLSNGDIGYVKDVYLDEEDMEVAKLEFSDERNVEYRSEDMDMVEHAYATTVHKSQGSEYPVVILPWIPMFYKMLRRNILYTAVTRAKVKVAIVGSKKAVYMAVHNTECDKRNTRLGERVVREYHKLVEKKCAVSNENRYGQQVINL